MSGAGLSRLTGPGTCEWIGPSGDRDGVKGVFHINAVGEVTPWQILGATAQISEAYLIPVLEATSAQFPFQIRGFHLD